MLRKKCDHIKQFVKVLLKSDRQIFPKQFQERSPVEAFNCKHWKKFMKK
ncbi:MAG: hypothetical protein ACFCU5_18370 [Pleurocapsa sp.]